MQGDTVREGGIKATRPKGQDCVPWASAFHVQGILPRFCAVKLFPLISIGLFSPQYSHNGGILFVFRDNGIIAWYNSTHRQKIIFQYITGVTDDNTLPIHFDC